MGVWCYLRIQFLERLFGRFPLRGVLRLAVASLVTGSYSSYKKEQEAFLKEAIEIL